MYENWKALLTDSTQNQRDLIQFNQEQTSCIVPLVDYSILQINGIQVETFLQGQLTNNVYEILPGQAQLNCYCNHKGRVIAILWLFKEQNVFRMLVNQSVVPLLTTELEKFGIFSKINVELLKDLSPVAIIHPLNTISDKFNINIQIANNPKRQVFILNRNELDTFSMNLPFDYKAAPINFWNYLNILIKFPDVTAAIQEKFTPHQLNLIALGAIHFKKGCYRGQEIVARMQYLGQLKQALYKIEIIGGASFEAGDTIIDKSDQILGHTINSIQITKESQLALAVLNNALITDTIQLKENQTIKIL